MGDNGNVEELRAETQVICKDEAKTESVETGTSEKKDGKITFGRVVHETGLVAAKTVTGVAIGAVAGIGAIAAIAVAEVTIPALMVLKICSFAGGSIGLLKGLSKKREK
jgi:hypothetical protein